MGDGINVAARLQAFAPVGGVLVSAAVMDLIAGRIEELGPLALRNIRRPVHAYVVGPVTRGARLEGVVDGAAAAARPEKRPVQPPSD